MLALRMINIVMLYFTYMLLIRYKVWNCTLNMFNRLSGKVAYCEGKGINIFKSENIFHSFVCSQVFFCFFFTVDDKNNPMLFISIGKIVKANALADRTIRSTELLEDITEQNFSKKDL